MAQSLREIAQALKASDKKVQLIYAFNGTGKTRLSQEFTELIDPKELNEEALEEQPIKVLYYNAFTEDLFYWDNDLDGDIVRKLKIHPNKFTNWIFTDQGQAFNIITNFQHYTSDKLTPRFNEESVSYDENGNAIIVNAYSEITFSIEGGNADRIENVKISKGEESNLIWCVFHSLLEQIIEVLNIVEPSDRDTNQFNNLQYVFIDDPVSSLDDTHLIELAVNIAQLIKSSQSTSPKFIITTHNPLFYNVLFNEFNNADNRHGYKLKHCEKKRLEKLDDGTFNLHIQSKDSPFAYHLFLLKELEKVAQSGDIQKYHFNFLRNILEKTSTFLGYVDWKELLPNEAEGSRDGYYNRIINLSSHSKFSGEEISVLTTQEKDVLKHLVREITRIYNFRSNINQPVTLHNVAV
ncbi:AAA family ATPase [Mucilaginibacter aquariorum]|uniref:AAA family ATPase n=1 Tax=Mucilaginibacter aquariorum TaxID=2967225 RepID=A0ABT1SZI3_9SPHI|nr:AAA family ATPase [Mucilaginibacter aquariorum]MCQ6957620.1 AAA family ATPase [Mucilaginibacter aquariorum]